MANKSLDQFDDIPVLDALDWLYIYDRETGKSYKVQAGALAALSGPVASVNSKTGDVTLSTDDISDAGKTNKYVTQAEKDKIAKIETAGDGTKVLANNGQYIIVSASGGGGIIAPVADLTTLKNIDTTSEADYPDKWVIYVESLKVLYAMDRESVATADDDLVVAPVAGPGRWMRNTLPLATPKKGGLQSGPDKAKQDKFTEGAGGELFFNGEQYLKDSEAVKLTQAEQDALATGETNLFTVRKNADGSVTYGAGIQQIDKLGAPALSSLLADDQAWVGQEIELTGDNANGALGFNSQEFYYKRRWYLCKSHTNTSVVWERNSTVDMLNAADTYDASIITELENETGWTNNIKTISVKSVKGDEYTSDTGYFYTCYSDDNKWRRVGEPATIDMYIQKAGNYLNLCNALEAHDFSLGVYDAMADANLTATDEKGSQGQRYYDSVGRTIYECVVSNATNIYWEKL
jgi:hypothetical protein